MEQDSQRELEKAFEDMLRSEGDGGSIGGGNTVEEAETTNSPPAIPASSASSALEATQAPSELLATLTPPPAHFTPPVIPGSSAFTLFQDLINRRQPPGSTPIAPLRPGASANEALQWLFCAFQSMKSIIQTHMPEAWNREQPPSTLPTFQSPQEPGGTPAPPLRSADVYNRVDELFYMALKMFAVIDGTMIAQTQPAQPAPPPPVPSAASTSEVPQSPQPPQVPPHERYTTGLAQFASLPDSGTTFMMNTVTRSYQQNEQFLRKSLQELAAQLQTFPEEDPRYVLLQSALGLAVLHLYEVTWEKEHLDFGVLATSLAWSKIEDPMDAAYMLPTLARNWAYGQRLLAQKTGDSDKLSIAVALSERMFDIVMDMDSIPSRAKQFLHTELACCLYERYMLLEDLGNLDACIGHFEILCGGDDVTHDMRCYLGHAHLQRYFALGNLDDLDRALYQATTAGSMAGVGDLSTRSADLDTAAGLHLSALCLEQKFRLQLDFEYLDKAIEKCRAAVQRLNEEHPLYLRCKSDLAILFLLRFESTEDPADLEVANEEVLVAIGVDRSERNTQVPLRVIWGLVQAVSGEDVDEGIRLISKARKEFAGPAYVESVIEEYLSRAVLHQYRTSKSKEDLVAALEHARLAFNKALEKSPRRAELAVELGRLLMTAYELDKVLARCDEAIQHFSWAAKASSARPTVRFQAATEWANAAEECHSETYIDALECGLDLLPALAWAGNRMPVQYRMLSSQSSTLASRAAAYAIGKGQLRKAVSYLEMGRNVLWSQALQFRAGGKDTEYRAGMDEDEFLAGYTPSQVHDDAHEYNPGEIRENVDRLPPELVGIVKSLQDAYKVAMQKLAELGGEEKAKRDMGMFGKFKEEFGSMYREASLHNAAARWDTLKKSLQSLRDSLSTPEALDWLGDERFVKLLEQGPVVIVNAYSVHCDALVVSCAAGERTATLRHVPLPEMSGDLALAWAEILREGLYNFGIGQITRKEFDDDVLVPVLQGLWRDMVLPIVENLREHGEVKERVWWYPTDALAFLPIHAAGPYENDEPGLQEMLASSYIPTLNSLVRACKAKVEPLQFLAVGMPATTSLTPLPNVEGELAAIQKHFDSQPEKLSMLTSEDATVYQVSKALLKHTWLHFACHAEQNNDYPFHSTFFMHDGPLKLSKLMRLDLTRVQFAYLSACHSAAGDAALPDESIHLAAGMQFSGVRSVIATMWTVYDQIAVRATRRVYYHLFKRNPDTPDVGYTAKALQLAVLDMKKNKVPLAFRVAFIHTGI
ncbi:CHAT domain-containing protein [Cyathus striatus]|nr:CHAT domain-containing protein [Cyathus striatus]